MKKFGWLILMLLFSACSVQKSFDVGEYETVIQKLDANPAKNTAEENYLVAESYRRSNRSDQSVKFYEAAIAGGIDELYPDAELFFSRALRANGKLNDAEQVLQDYVTKVEDQEVRKRVENELKNIKKVNEIRKQKSWYKVNNLSDINTPSAEYSPTYNNNRLYFTSNREGGKTYRATGTPFTDLYEVATKGANVNLRTLRKLSSIINDPNVNEGSIAVSPDGLWVIFGKGNSGKPSGNKQVNLYFSRYRNGRWTDPRPLSVNDPNAWDSTPALSKDGLTLYWASNRAGGYGGTDIYSAKLDRRGRWVDVRNLGPEINTYGNESFPFSGEDGSLYFSSDGHPGFGYLDMFAATRKEGQIEVTNLGQPMNSEADDFAFFQFDLTRGFFSSNRKGGKGDDDIYTFVNEDPNLKIVNYYLRVTTFTKDDGGNEIILPNTKVRLVDAADYLVDEAFAGEDGKTEFRIYPEEIYNLIGEKTDYFTTRSVFSTIDETVDKTKLKDLVTDIYFDAKILMDRVVIEKEIVLENIYYDFDKWNIRTDAAKVLDSLVLIMNDNPEISIELGSHTDERGDDTYNLDLSRKRAISAVRYIIGQGIDPDRITAKGYGETKLLIPNASTEEDHQTNRRTTFTVLKYNPKNREDSLPVNENEQDEYDRFFIDIPVEKKENGR